MKAQVQSRRRSRFGCRNCKLRKVKCDETRPACSKCRSYAVLCNFDLRVPDLQPVGEAQPSPEEQGLAKQANVAPIRAPVGHAVWTDDGYTFHALDTEDCQLFYRFRSRTLPALGGDEMVDIYEGHMLAQCFTHPFLMHGTLAVAAVHDRYLGATSSRRRSIRESYHAAQCTTMFSRWLSQQPIAEDRKDPLWAAAGILSVLSFASIDFCRAEDAWPLRAPASDDLEWMQLGAGKMALFRLVDPARPGSVFARMFPGGGLERHVVDDDTVPEQGTEGVSPALVQLCGMHSTSTADTNPYFALAHGISRMSAGVSTTAEPTMRLRRVLAVSRRMSGDVADRLHSKDSVALALLALWYSQARTCRWWIDARAQYEIPAIRMYLQQDKEASEAWKAIGSWSHQA